ncbi:FKBP-type peptidyl-prolyl cis-trans isomerase [Armatimonas rosea]|uniref:peptidylprolyl isomerase n=1 Tax=Armatimonas rosea TaxID=685828 RepID=A0A7W9SVD4_ARMRO|nr:FKBP-type peptidyl-prolyl cis-trans isomerase [Armatimonas rosea]MBB6053542.1 outer membrane lipoprotein-sorting protein [Armatimonas rosea]
MQETTLAPEVKAALTRCFAAHKALRSYSAEVAITVRGAPNQREGRVRVSLQRPDHLRLECDGPRALSGTRLVVATDGFVYSADSKTRSYKAEAVPHDGNPLAVALDETGLIPLPIFSKLFSEPDGLETCLAMFKTLTLDPGTLTFHGDSGGSWLLRFDPKDKILREVSYTQGTALTFREVYQTVRVNPALPTTLWWFEPPAGYRDQDGPPEVFPPAPSLGKGAVKTAAGLVYLDLKVGKGPAAVKGSQVAFHYKSTLTNGRPCGSSREEGSGQPMRFTVPGQVLPALNDAVLGMRPGGRRKLIVPPALAFGERGSGKVIPGNATIIMEIEMLDVKEPHGQ